MPDKPKSKNTATITDDELANEHTRLLRRAKRYISEATTLSDGKLRHKEMLVLFQKMQTKVESKVMGKCPPGKIEDRSTGLCVTKP